MARLSAARRRRQPVVSGRIDIPGQVGGAVDWETLIHGDGLSNHCSILISRIFLFAFTKQINREKNFNINQIFP
jgi:hypothetical protein